MPLRRDTKYFPTVTGGGGILRRAPCRSVRPDLATCLGEQQTPKESDPSKAESLLDPLGAADRPLRTCAELPTYEVARPNLLLPYFHDDKLAKLSLD